MTPLLMRSLPELEGVPSAALRRFAAGLDRLDSVHSLMVLRHGKVIAEAWKKPYAPEVPHMLFSLSKSFTSVAVGMACAEGKLSLDAKIAELFADKLPENLDPKYLRMTLRHLLSMTSGHDHCTMNDMTDTPDWERSFFASPLAWEPGTRFQYNSGATYMLAAALVRATGEGLQDFLRKRLLSPLGIQPRYWERSPSGIEVGGWGFYLTTEEIAVFAQCLLDGGRWRGWQLIPPDYLALATSVQSDNSMNEQPDWKVGYGFQFWRCRHGAFRGDGAFGQYAVVMPKEDMAVAITSGLGGMQAILDLLWSELLPAAASEPLPPDPENQAALQQELAAWAMPVLGSEGRDLPLQSYRFDENPLGLRELTVRSTPELLEVALDGETLLAGYGCAIDNRLSWKEPLSHRMTASARWNSPTEVEFLACLYETPYQWNFKLKFEADGVRLERRANLSFRRSDWPPLTARE